MGYIKRKSIQLAQKRLINWMKCSSRVVVKRGVHTHGFSGLEGAAGPTHQIHFHVLLLGIVGIVLFDSLTTMRLKLFIRECGNTPFYYHASSSDCCIVLGCLFYYAPLCGITFLLEGDSLHNTLLIGGHQLFKSLQIKLLLYEYFILSFCLGMS